MKKKQNEVEEIGNIKTKTYGKRNETELESARGKTQNMQFETWV